MLPLIALFFALNNNSVHSERLGLLSQNLSVAQKNKPSRTQTNGNPATPNTKSAASRESHDAEGKPQKVEIIPQPFTVSPQPTDIWLKWYVGFTAVIAIFSIVAAWAAVKQAYATRQKERAWLIAIIEEPPESLLGPQSGEFSGPTTPGAITLVTNIYRVGCKIQNQGNSPAWLTARAEKLQVVPARENWIDELPNIPDYGPITNLGDYGAAMPPNAILPAPLLLNPNDAPDIEQGNKALYVYGFARYRDAFRAKHETRYCFRLKIALGVADPKSRGFYIAGPPAYNKAT